MKKIKKHDDAVMTFTKRWVSRIMWFSCFWVTWSYVLASLGREAIAEELSNNIVIVIVATVITYGCKSYFETYSEKKNELIKEGHVSHEESEE